MLTIGQHSFWQCHTSLRCQQKLEQLEHLRSEDTPPPPPPPHDYPYYWLILDPKSKEDKVKVKNLKNLPKFQILKQTLHMAHLLQLLDKMCKYQMGPTNIVEDTEQTRFCPQMDRRTDRQGETSKPPLQLCWNGGYNEADFMKFKGHCFHKGEFQQALNCQQWIPTNFSWPTSSRKSLSQQLIGTLHAFGPNEEHEKFSFFSQSLASANPQQANYNKIIYCQTSNISQTLAGNKIVDRSDVVGAAPVGAALIASSFST